MTTFSRRRARAVGRRARADGRRTVRPELAKTQNELFHFLQQFLNVNREEISEKQDAKGILGQTLLLFEILYVLCD